MSTIHLDRWKADTDRQGNLIVFGTSNGQFFESKPLIPQVVDGNKLMQISGIVVALHQKDDGAWDQRLGMRSPFLHGLLKRNNLV